METDEDEEAIIPRGLPDAHPPLAAATPASVDVTAAEGPTVDAKSDGSKEDDSSDGNWSSGSSFTGCSDEESVLSFDTADADSINFVRPSGDKSHWGSIHSTRDKPYSRPEGEGSWRMDPEDSYSDYTIIVTSEGTSQERTYYVHKFILAHGPCGCEYFVSLFRTPCLENADGFSRFVFPSEVANFFPDFLDIIYQPSYVENISLWYRKSGENLYGGNLLPLRSLALYFGCDRLLSNIKWRIKDDVNAVHNHGHYPLQNMAKYVTVLCEDETAEDSEELLSHIVGVLVRCFDHFASADMKPIMSSIIEAMSPDVLLSLLLQVTSTLTSRYRIFESKSSEPFSSLVIQYLNENLRITTWHFERVVLYLLDLLQPNTDANKKMARELSLCGERRGMYTEFVQRAVEGYADPPLETFDRIKASIELLNSRGEVNLTRVVIEGTFNGNQSPLAVRYGGSELGGNQGEPDVLWVKTIPEMTSEDVKALIFGKIGLRPELQQIAFKDQDNALVLFEEPDTLQMIETMWRDDALFLKATAYCPPKKEDNAPHAFE
mmetsp:Transcript_945/g.2639  ORF Transcript_945/g.2639 Transcript_945/m.2639 type:complete len:548 (-) Transcript_945:44-1687(-)